VALQLRQRGVGNVYALIGGYEEWLKRGDPIVKGITPG
jgi:rhodanese-related sulfurtransferase